MNVMQPAIIVLIRQMQQQTNERPPCSLQLIGDVDASNDLLQKKPKRIGGKSVNNFIQKTFDILQQKRYENIVSWSDSSESSQGGDRVCSFKIHNVRAFEETVLPLYFKHSNLSSFVRQLNMYSFHKVRGDKNEFEFEHDRFVRNRPDLLPEIKRKQIQSTASIPSGTQFSNPDLPVQTTVSKPLQKKEKGVSLQEIESPQKDLQPSIMQASSNEKPALKLADLQQINNNLKKTKQLKITALRQNVMNNKLTLAAKFNKVVMAIIEAKLQQDLNGLECASGEVKYNLNSLHKIVDHIMDNSENRFFREYLNMANPLFQGKKSEK